jgi:hypothetical protein
MRVQHHDDHPLGSGSSSVGEKNKKLLSFISKIGLESPPSILVNMNLNWFSESEQED